MRGHKRNGKLVSRNIFDSDASEIFWGINQRQR